MINAEATVLIVAMGSTVLLMGWIVWLFSRRKQEKVRAQLDVQRRMLDKFSTGPEFATFVESENGRRFMESLSTEHATHADRILGSIQRGAVLTLLGIALCVLPVYDRDFEATALLGVIALAAGIGFLISAWVSHRLLKEWGLVPPGTT
jgi:uncharacterized membrane protein